jgi:hypothetical protein
MWIPARELSAGDVVRIHDWRLHVVAVDNDLGTAVLTAEFDFLLHFARHETVEVEHRSRELTPAA